MSPQFRVTLTKEEVEELQKISSTGSRSAKIVLFARALLLLDKGSHTAEHWTVIGEIFSTISSSTSLSARSLTVHRVRPSGGSLQASWVNLASKAPSKITGLLLFPVGRGRIMESRP